MDPSGSEPTDDELAAEAEAEAEAAQARAEAARARATELRQKLRDAPATGDAPVTGDAPADAGVRRVPPLAAVLTGVGAAATAALLTATGLMLWQNQQSADQRQRTAEFAAAARQGVVNLMAIDYNTAAESVRRVLDGSTGTFRENFAETAEDFAKALRAEKIVTTAVINDVAVEQATADTAVVLVSATSRREGPNAPKDQQQPRVWRVVVNLEREAGQIKMSGVEFV